MTPKASWVHGGDFGQLQLLQIEQDDDFALAELAADRQKFVGSGIAGCGIGHSPEFRRSCPR